MQCINIVIISLWVPAFLFTNIEELTSRLGLRAVIVITPSITTYVYTCSPLSLPSS